MIKIDEEKTIYITRGDSTNEINKLPISYNDYEFKENDKLKLVVMEKKGYTKEIILEKDFIVKENADEVFLVLSSDDTLEFPLENKKITYWYDIILNDETTIYGFDENNAKKLVVYPGGVNNE